MVWLAAARWSPEGTTLWHLVWVLLLLENAAAHHYKRLCSANHYFFPLCLANTEQYECECGPGFFWNTHMCVALGVDSRFEFASLSPASYSLLNAKPFPELRAFTIALWLRVPASYHPGTVLSYQHGRNYNMIRLTTGPFLQLQMYDDVINTDIVVDENSWFHLAWTWTSEGGRWSLYINGTTITRQGTAPTSRDRLIPAAGEFVLGQASRTPLRHNQFDLTTAYKGDMAFVNIWSETLELPEILDLLKDCSFSTCGDAVEWADFRAGTRGAMKIRWPSDIQIGDKKPCFAKEEAAITCDKYCSHAIGALCKSEIVANVAWARTPVGSTVSQPCPGLVDEEGRPLAYANRSCVATADNDGQWAAPAVEDCISESQWRMRQTIHDVIEEDSVNTSQVLLLAERLLNKTAVEQFHTPMDIATALDSVHMLISAQEEPFHRGSGANGPMRYVRTHPNSTPQIDDTDFFAKTVVGILDHIIYERNSPAWLKSLPPGIEGDRLLKVIRGYLESVYIYLKAAAERGDMDPGNAQFTTTHAHMGFQTRLYGAGDPLGVHFPNYADNAAPRLLDELGSVSLSGEALVDFMNNSNVDYIGVSMGRFVATHILPNHNVSSKSKEDNVNSAIAMLLLYTEAEVENLTQPIIVHFPYINNFNISNPECVHLVPGGASGELWHWAHGLCSVVQNTSSYAVCHCVRPGVFAVTTDMYNINLAQTYNKIRKPPISFARESPVTSGFSSQGWNPGEEPLPLMQVPSYIGCALSALLCLVSCLMLIYLRTSSKTAAIHKNFALAVVGSQLTFMFGIDKLQYRVICQTFAISFHYFFLSVFAWLMNEAFNLYIVITYAAHAHDDHESSSQWKDYILGWVLPAAIVGAFVGTHTDDYYAPDMCWISWQYIWLFLGPAIGIISVTILVLIFTAKEHHESAYAKNEQTNKMISIHAKALWTQAILLTICWAFAFLTLKMRGIIIKCLYAMFNVLQGAFFLVFYFLLNEEVRAVLSVRRKRKTLAKHGYDYSPSGSDDSDGEATPANVGGNSIELSDKVHTSNHKNGKRRRNKKSQIEVSSDEASDCEMMITSV